MTVRELGNLAGEKWMDPIFWARVIQLAKTVVAAVAAWILATVVFHLQQPFLAPWAALLVVHATVYRTFARGARQVGAAVIGVLLAWVIGSTLGLDPFAVAVALLVGLTLDATPWFKEEATAVAATTLIVLTTGFTNNDNVLLTRLADTSIGIVVGLLVNVMVWPPLHQRTATVAIDAIDDSIGQLLVDIARKLGDDCTQEDADEWVDRTRSLDSDLDTAWSLVRHARESARLNLRQRAATVRRPGEWNDLLRRMEQAVAETRSMARTLGHSIHNVNAWESDFRTGWVALLEETGMAIQTAESDRIGSLRSRLSDFAGDLPTKDHSARHWPEYGALIINLRNIVTSMDRVAVSNPMISHA